jgi:hypothetical protein
MAICTIKSDIGALVTNDREIENILNKHFATTGEKLAGLLNNRHVPRVEPPIVIDVMEIEIQEESAN